MSMDLVVKITGDVIDSNFDDYRNQWNRALQDVNLNPATDNEFADAKEFVKTCQSAEDAIGQAMEKALSNTSDIKTLFDGMSSISAKIKEVRLSLNKTIQEEESSRKKRVVASAIKMVADFIEQREKEQPYLAGHFTVTTEDFVPAIKGKRSIEKIKTAVFDHARFLISTIGDIAQECRLNFERINMAMESDSSYRSLFPDIKELVTKPGGEVLLTIDARILKFKAEAEKNLRIEAEKKASLTHEREPVPVSELVRKGGAVPGAPLYHLQNQGGSPEVRGETVVSNLPPDLPVERSVPKSHFIMTVTFLGEHESVVDIAKKIDREVSAYPEVQSIVLKKN